MKTNQTVSAVICTIGDRQSEIDKTLKSLIAQDIKICQIVIVDQNKHKLLVPIIDKYSSFTQIDHVRTEDLNIKKSFGASWARNVGLNYIKTDYVFFPDDDCWYPKNFVSECLNSLKEFNVDFVCGRAADELSKKSINAFFLNNSTMINKMNVWFTSIEWTIFYKSKIVKKVDGYDETLGVGARTKWGAAEGQDLLIRLLSKGFRGYFNYDIIGHHALVKLNANDSKNLEKLRSYGRGTGRVLMLHKYFMMFIILSLMPLFKIPLSLLKLNFNDIKARFFISIAIFEGYFSKNG